MSNEAIKRGVDPYADADYVKRKMENAAVDRIQFTVPETELLAGTAIHAVASADGYVSGAYTVVSDAVTTGGSLTVEVNTVAVDGLTVTVADAAAAGDVDSGTATADHSTARVRAGDAITITPSAAFAGAGALNGVLLISLD